MGKKLFSVMAVVMASTFALTACSSTTDAADTASASVSAGGEVERGASESSSRTVAIVNNTGSDITLSISGTDNYDWDSARPDNAAPEGFQGTLLASGGTETRALTTNTEADGAPFTINFGVTGVSVELNTKREFNAKRGISESVTRFNGWGQRNDRTECETNTMTKNGYTITVECKGVLASPNTTITITK
jgi:hypothetical protein